MNEDFMAFLENFTYPTKKKTLRIIELKNDKDVYKIINSNIIISFITLIITYLSIIVAIICFEISIKTLLISITIFMVLLGYTYKLYIFRETKKKKIDDDYEQLRMDLITLLNYPVDHELCKHNQLCNCKEQYLIRMNEEYHINLIYK